VKFNSKLSIVINPTSIHLATNNKLENALVLCKPRQAPATPPARNAAACHYSRMLTNEPTNKHDGSQYLLRM